MPLIAAQAWDDVWNGGKGRRPSEGGTVEGFTLACELGIRFEPVVIGSARHWVPREATDGELDSRSEEKQAEAKRHPEHAHPEALEWAKILAKEVVPSAAPSEPLTDSQLETACHDMGEAWQWVVGDTNGDNQLPILLAPQGLTPHDIGLEPEDTPSWALEVLSPDPTAWWVQLWNGGAGRRVADGGTAEGTKLTEALGIQFAPAPVGGHTFWLPRASNPDQWSKAEREGPGPETRGLSPAEPGRMEERGWMTWGASDAGVIVGDN